MTRLYLIIPHLEEIEKEGPSFIDTGRDKSLLSMRWYWAAMSGACPISIADSHGAEGVKLFSDYFLIFQKYDLPHDVVLVSESIVPHEGLAVAYNSYLMNYLKKFDPNLTYRHQVVEGFNDKSVILAPMGGEEEHCHKNFHKSKTILLDEPHRLILENWNEDNLQYVYAYKKAIAICKLLEKRGFEITTFCSSGHKNARHLPSPVYPAGRWIPYLKLMLLYKQNCMFFNPFQESHGYSTYENLQMGNSIITFSENFNILTSKQFQNGVVLSLYFSDSLCVQMIEEYFDRYVNQERHGLIKKESNELYSTNTFASRVKKAMGVRCTKLL